VRLWHKGSDTEGLKEDQAKLREVERDALQVGELVGRLTLLAESLDATADSLETTADKLIKKEGHCER